MHVGVVRDAVSVASCVVKSVGVLQNSSLVIVIVVVIHGGMINVTALILRSCRTR